jgi:hypothetical protein
VHASTRTIDLNEVADASPPRAREKRTRHVGTARTATEPGPGVDLAQAADICIGSRRCAKRVHSRLAYGVEHALFAVMLAATGYLYLGVFLKQAI